MARNVKQLSYGELAGFCDRMSTILGAGISSYEGVTALLETEDEAESRAILQSIANALEEGHSFYYAIEQTEVFPPYVLQMIEIGEHTGNLDSVLASLSSYCRKENSIREGIRRAVLYPIVMIAMMLIVMGVLILKVLPIFQDIYSELGAGLSGFSYTALSLSEWLSNHFLGILLVITVAVLIVVIYLFSKPGRQRLASSTLSREIAAERFANCMSLSLHSGLDSDQGMDFAQKLVDNPVISKAISECREHVSEGERFETALINAGIFSGIYNSMVLIGSKTGSMDEMMEKIAEGYEQLSSQRIARWISRLEPALVIILSVVVGALLLSFLLPLLGIMSSIG